MTMNLVIIITFSFALCLPMTDRQIGMLDRLIVIRQKDAQTNRQTERRNKQEMRNNFIHQCTTRNGTRIA